MWSILVAMAVVAAVTEPGKRCPGSPNQCSLHGSCMINRHGEYICNCQWGYTGFDCAQKMCPHGFDPVTSDAVQEKKLRVSILHLPPSSSILVQFHGHVVELDAAAGGATHLTTDVCAQVFRRFRNLGDLSCASTAVSADASSSSLPVAEFDLTLHSFPVYPVMNNLFHHAGNPSASDFSCDPPSACRFTSLTDANIKAYLPCSNHGLCNAVSGLCACEPGYHGVHCGSNVDAGTFIACVGCHVLLSTWFDG
ncbi:hypothetical protein DYB30_013259 [Aphanomyces astaci]|uniref:EGF-like domain-containing protein n=2 Tax=Aphanomyces astaci TaxID=112090 RepID=A0A397D917_APHAT|nr:hypothetical protein DYB30_013259 [Aphanomyces astaci]